MDVAAVHSVETRLASLKHTGALTTDQFQLLKAQAKAGLVTDQVLSSVAPVSGRELAGLRLG